MTLAVMELVELLHFPPLLFGGFEGRLHAETGGQCDVRDGPNQAGVGLQPVDYNILVDVHEDVELYALFLDNGPHRERSYMEVFLNREVEEDLNFIGRLQLESLIQRFDALDSVQECAELAGCHSYRDTCFHFILLRIMG